jgi:hypothetical protein
LAVTIAESIGKKNNFVKNESGESSDQEKDLGHMSSDIHPACNFKKQLLN